MDILDKFDFLGMIALAVAPTRSRSTMLTGAGVTSVMPRVSSRARQHVPRKTCAKSASKCEAHLNNHGMNPVLHPSPILSEQEAARNSLLA
jgi:hypothetical protein